MTYLTHDEGGSGLPGTYVACPFAWEATLPGYSHDSGATGTVEVWIEGRVMDDGEVEDVEATYDGREVEIPTREYERACKALVEAVS